MVESESCKQQMISLSLGEAEFYVLVHGTAAGIFFWQVAVALGFARLFSGAAKRD